MRIEVPTIYNEKHVDLHRTGYEKKAISVSDIYVHSPNKISNFLSRIRETGIPQKATTNWLESIGFTSKNDRSLLKLLQPLGFINADKTPTTTWQQYRGGDHAIILAESIRSAYKELFDVYPRAFNASTVDVRAAFMANSKLGSDAVRKMVSTFFALTKEADFSKDSETRDTSVIDTAPNALISSGESVSPKPSNESKQSVNSATNSLALHIDVQVHIDPEASAEQIDIIFASMAKHLSRL